MPRLPWSQDIRSRKSKKKKIEGERDKWEERGGGVKEILVYGWYKGIIIATYLNHIVNNIENKRSKLYKQI